MSCPSFAGGGGYRVWGGERGGGTRDKPFFCGRQGFRLLLVAGTRHQGRFLESSDCGLSGFIYLSEHCFRPKHCLRKRTKGPATWMTSCGEPAFVSPSQVRQSAKPPRTISHFPFPMQRSRAAAAYWQKISAFVALSHACLPRKTTFCRIDYQQMAKQKYQQFLVFS